MPCMCGDTACPSCGPAQGYDPEFEKVCEWLQFAVFRDLPECIQGEWFAGYVADRLGKALPQTMIDELEKAARRWGAEQREWSRV